MLGVLSVTDTLSLPAIAGAPVSCHPLQFINVCVSVNTSVYSLFCKTRAVQCVAVEIIPYYSLLINVMCVCSLSSLLINVICVFFVQSTHQCDM